ncbi:MAG: TetR/AcrR family transcriptional regulator [Candidatus Abyssobacteria bacterium SURF_5]|uniref:TetR/AcrR family transcriptional regulator n=1 Tax=Abyssobacteria bacterium (strain SURF_5) TaxID=2093360 RepID=A0A3A4NFD1_ABYX5|nr:MAG: TetR/AcrR family transcriptional regulator [Candidatus Abyssubacteria bacterium SURF_5]
MARTHAAEIAREVTKRELLGAALEVFVAKGYPAATISDIVRAAGVTQGTFYLYFQNKKDIFAVLLQEYRKLVISGLFNVDLDSVRTKEDWIALANRIGSFLLDHIKTHGDYMRLFIAETTTIGSSFLNEADVFSGAITDEIGRLLRHGLKMNLLRDIDVKSVSLSCLGALKEAVRQSCFGNVPSTADEIIPRIIRSQAELLLK